MIVIWSGAIVDIPAGWALCNGANGTPDLRDKFIVGAGTTYAVGAAGGNNTHLHAFTSDLHSHQFVAGAQIEEGPDFGRVTDEVAVTGDTDLTNHLPLYYALAYIMKT